MVMTSECFESGADGKKYLVSLVAALRSSRLHQQRTFLASLVRLVSRVAFRNKRTVSKVRPLELLVVCE